MKRCSNADVPLLLSVDLWSISTLIPGIPVLAIMVRYNLLNSGTVGPKAVQCILICLPACTTPPPAPSTPLATVRGRESAQTVCCVPVPPVPPVPPPPPPPTMHHQASFLGVVAPWLVTMFCYQGSLLVSFCNWSALLTIGTVNLVVPLAVYREALRRYPLITSEANGTALLQEVTELCAQRHPAISPVPVW
eukprot:COSAG01_NODE_225_length_21277_cov_71.340023_21_plen_192_part_00